MNTTISSGILDIIISTKGAELQSIFNNKTNLEYLWSGDEKFWGKKSPVLFPIVGGLKNGKYSYQGKEYSLGRHGFARDHFFEFHQQTEQSITFLLKSNNTTLQHYPFHFNFFITYTVEENKLLCTYAVENTGKEKMYFSCGAHPAFKVPLTPYTNFDDWFLEFSSVEHTKKYPLSADGLLLKEPVECLNNIYQLQLSKSLFYKDALVFKNLQSTTISIGCKETPHGLSMSFDGFPFYGIWSAKDADFVCLEPWCGIADSIDASGKLEDKEGIIQLDPNQFWKNTWTVEVY